MTTPGGGSVGPGDSVGVVYASVRFTGDKAPSDVARILDDASDDGNAEMEDIGDKWGETLDSHLKSSTKNTGRDVARGITAGIDREGVKVTRESIDFDRNTGHRIVGELLDDVADALKDEQGSSAFKKIGEAFTTAIGAGFNVSGRSSLIGFLIPVIGIIVEVVGAALEGVAALTAALFVIPNLVFAIGLQAGVLMLAFQGIGEAIPKAFAAKNLEEFNKALEGLTPAAKDFVGQIILLRDSFKPLQQLAQEGFFTGLGDALLKAFGGNAPFIQTLSVSIGPLAESLGRLAGTLVNFLNDPAFNRFVLWIIPQITTWLDKFGPSMTEFLVGLSELGFALLPFFVWFGQVVNDALSGIGEWFTDLANSKGFLEWLEEAKGDLGDVWDLLKQAGALIKAFFTSLDEAGDENGGFIKALTEQLLFLTEFFKSPLGEGAIRGLISVAVVLSQIFTGLLIVIGLLLVAFEGVRMAVVDFGHWLGGLGDYVTTLDDKFKAFFTGIFNSLINFGNWGAMAFQNFRDKAVQSIIDAKNQIVGNFENAINSIGNFFSSLPSRISNAVGDLYGLLWSAGGRLIQGLIDGALSKIGPLRSAFSWLMQSGVHNFLPHSPAKEGPLSGEGDPMIAGATIVQRIATGMEMEAPGLRDASSMATSNVLVGAGAVQMNFYGQTPTTAQASGIGAAAGNSLAATIAQRNARLAVRSLGSGT